MSKSDKAAAHGPAEVTARIEQRRKDLAATLDEIAVRVHPSTIAGDARARALSAVDQRVAQAYVRANTLLSDLRAGMVTADGSPRMDRVVPAALVAVGVVGLVVVTVSRRRD